MDFSDEMIDEILKIFQVESDEIISKLNNSLLDLEKDPHNKDAILNLFRDAHTLKGASRMVGFNNVQTLAHKMEDVLGLAKENKIELNSEVVNILYKTVDFLSELIQKSIQKKQEIYSNDISNQISDLENINKFARSVSKYDEKIDFNSELFIENIEQINNLISECLYHLMKLESKQNETMINNLLTKTKELYAIFKNIGVFEIRSLLEDISVKLELTMKGSNSLTIQEINEIHAVFDNIIEKLSSNCELFNLEVIDYYSFAFSKTSEIDYEAGTFKIKEEKPKETNEKKIEKDLTEKIQQKNIYSSVPQDFETKPELKDIGIKIIALSQNQSSIGEILTLIQKYELTCTEENIKNILKKIIEILDFASKNEIQPDEETISVINQSIEYCNNTLENKTDIVDKDLVLQRLEIVQQVLIFNEEKLEEEKSATTKVQNLKQKKVDAFSDIFNTEEIKTLRVESSKLDTLINQVNELMITKIKTQEHLHELQQINNELAEWQKNSIKALEYLKYYDKKYFQSSLADNPISFFIKQLLGLFTENNRKVQETVYNITGLKRTIQEDDAKMGLIVDNVENMVKNIRVLPLATVFHLFGRMVRDIAQEKNKKIDFEIIGSETSTDKKIIEEIKTPLIHIIRNSIDHGIETIEERRALGKPEEGKIILSARQSNNKIIIEITDDGRGINIEKIKEKALQKGLLTEEELKSMNNEQITNIIFAPGFSTGDEITNISGRGIGLDVVQSKISQLNGKVKVISELHRGCCVQIELPTTMAILKAFLVKSNKQTFAIPMEVINTVIRKKEEEIIISSSGKSIIFNDETLPFYEIDDILKLPKATEKEEKKTILIIESDGKTIALGVSKLLGDQEILHKKLSAPFYKLKNISGITTLASGEICLILNISDIVKSISYTTVSLGQKPTKLIKNSSLKILLVEDSTTIRTLERNILVNAGYKVETAKNPVEAFEIMKKNQFNLIITDVEMPEMNGFEFLEKLKTNELYADIPTIMISSQNLEENKLRAHELGVEKYIVKSEFNQNDFQKTVKEILNKYSEE